MDTARIAALLEPFLEQPLPPSRLDQVSIYIDLLQSWNARINLTAIRQEEEIVTRHFGESLFMARHLFPTSVAQAPSPAISGKAQTTPVNPPHVLDIGSGAGFPAVPLKLWAPHIHLTLIESNHKKAAFLREVVRTLTLTDVNVIADRVETLASRSGFARPEVVTLRAVERFDTILPQALALLAPSATLALLIGSDQIPQLAAMTALSWQPPIPVPQSKRRVLSIGLLERSGNTINYNM
jgi:16S rRNA (guanine527-N7)-methyltransferase